MCFFGKVVSVLSRNNKDFLIFSQSKENTRARQIADVLRHIRFSHELSVTDERLRRSSNVTRDKCYLLPKTKCVISLNTEVAGLGFNYRTLISFIGATAKLRGVSISLIVSVCLSVRPSSWNNSSPSRRIFMKFYT